MRNMKVGQKLILTFAVILIMFIVASIVLLNLTSSVMSNFSYFYNHPYLVSNAARDIKSEMLTMRVAAKDIILSGETVSLLHTIDVADIQIDQNILVLKDNYLGKPADIDAFEEKYRAWQDVRDHVLDLVKKDKIQEATKLSVGDADRYSKEILDRLDKILVFANDKAATFYAQAAASRLSAQRLSFVFLAITFVLAVILTILLTRNITSPIKAMMNVITRVENGTDAVEINTAGRKDELGRVSQAFNDMLKYLKTKKELSEINLTLAHHKTLEQFRITLMSIGDGVISADINGKVNNMNPVAEMLTGWQLAQAQGKPIEEVFHIINAKTQAKAENPLKKVLELGTIIGLANHTVLISKNGERFHIADSAAPIRDDAGNLYGVVLVFRDVTEDYRKQEEIAYMSFHDKLTGLYNRAFFEEEINRMNTIRQMPLSIVMGDINGLKLINDTFGHLEGDKYLAAAAYAIKACCRAEDIVARWGGDEFVILLPRTSAEESQAICERISEAYSAIGSFKIIPSIAMGCAVQLEVQQDYQKTLKDAETNMYRHKLLDKGSIRNAIVASLDNSLNERDFITEEHAQALVSLCSKVGKRLGINANQYDELELLARLHDIGKIAISDTILSKPGPLDLEEWVSMKKHAEIGYRIAMSVSGLEHIADGILSHHERWDGSGYPNGLSGQEIPYNARIIAVADAFDAMTRGRPYKEAISTEEAVAELRRCSGTQFDPFVLEQFLIALEDEPDERTA